MWGLEIVLKVELYVHGNSRNLMSYVTNFEDKNNPTWNNNIYLMCRVNMLIVLNIGMLIISSIIDAMLRNMHTIDILSSAKIMPIFY